MIATQISQEALSPVTGKIIRIFSVEPGLSAVQIFIYPWQPHTVFAPFAARIRQVQLVKGRRLPAFMKVAREVNTRMQFSLLLSCGCSMRLNVVGGITTRYIRSLLCASDDVKLGQPMAEIVLGSMVEVIGSFHVNSGLRVGASVIRGESLGVVIAS